MTGAQQTPGAQSTDQGNCLVWLWLSGLAIVLDLVIKYLASTLLTYASPVEILPIFDLTLLHNTGAAFSFLANAGGWQRWLFAGIALVVSVMIVFWLRKTPRHQWWLGLGLSMVLGGAIGNMYDRVVHGYVVDYLSFHYAGWYFPAFNLADICITLGAGLLIIDMLFLADDAVLKSKSKDS